MRTWIRHTELSNNRKTPRTEMWEYRQDGKTLDSFPIFVELGKSLDVLGLKGASLDRVLEYAAFLQKSADNLYAAEREFTEIKFCPCCDSETTTATVEFAVFGIPYHSCSQCGHRFVRKQPKVEELDRQFEVSEELSEPYTDKTTQEIRLKQVIEPKVEWVCEVYRKYYGRNLSNGLDVGAGGGHFVEGLRRIGVESSGFELSKASRRFAEFTFGLDLRFDDFLTAEPNRGEQYDLITFWGLLEYIQLPKRFLETARNWLRQGRGMLVVEVPRFDCLGTAIQKEFPATVARHLDPTTHVNCFSDASLATALYDSGFKPIAAWYFGMDIYESLVQLSLHSHVNLIDEFANLIPPLQAGVDQVQWDDDLVVAAVPLEG